MSLAGCKKTKRLRKILSRFNEDMENMLRELGNGDQADTGLHCGILSYEALEEDNILNTIRQSKDLLDKAEKSLKDHSTLHPVMRQKATKRDSGVGSTTSQELRCPIQETDPHSAEILQGIAQTHPKTPVDSTNLDAEGENLVENEPRSRHGRSWPSGATGRQLVSRGSQTSPCSEETIVKTCTCTNQNPSSESDSQGSDLGRTTNESDSENCTEIQSAGQSQDDFADNSASRESYHNSDNTPLPAATQETTFDLPLYLNDELTNEITQAIAPTVPGIRRSHRCPRVECAKEATILDD